MVSKLGIEVMRQDMKTVRIYQCPFRVKFMFLLLSWIEPFKGYETKLLIIAILIGSETRSYLKFNKCSTFELVFSNLRAHINLQC